MSTAAYWREWRAKNPQLSREISRRGHRNTAAKRSMAHKKWRSSDRARWLTLKVVSKRKNTLCDLSLEYFQQVISSKKCTYCDGPLNSSGTGLDRKDASLGYVEGNVVSCCWFCNTIKAHLLTYEEMLNIKETLISARIRREAQPDKYIKPKSLKWKASVGQTF